MSGLQQKKKNFIFIFFMLLNTVMLTHTHTHRRGSVVVGGFMCHFFPMGRFSISLCFLCWGLRFALYMQGKSYYFCHASTLHFLHAAVKMHGCAGAHLRHVDCCSSLCPNWFLGFKHFAKCCWCMFHAVLRVCGCECGWVCGHVFGVCVFVLGFFPGRLKRNSAQGVRISFADCCWVLQTRLDWMLSLKARTLKSSGSSFSTRSMRRMHF